MPAICLLRSSRAGRRSHALLLVQCTPGGFEPSLSLSEQNDESEQKFDEQATMIQCGAKRKRLRNRNSRNSVLKGRLYW